MATSDDDDDDDDDARPPDYDDTIYHRRWMTRAETSRSTLASYVATEGSSLFSLSFVGSLPEPPPYRPYNTATTDETTGAYNNSNNSNFYYPKTYNR